MSRLRELIDELCPDGVEYKTLGEVGQFLRGSSFQKKHFVEAGSPCIHYGQVHTQFGVSTDHVVSYLDESFAARMKRAQHGDLVIATTSEDDEAVGKATAWMGDYDVVVSNDAFIYRHTLDPMYVSYFFASDQFQQAKMPFVTGAKVRRLSGDDMSKIRIPVPPIEVQREIVRILDSFQELDDALTAEIEAREKQLQTLLRRIDINETNESQSKPFKDCCVIGRGTYITKKDVVEGDVPVVMGGLEPAYYHSVSNHTGEALVISRSGVNAGFSSFWNQPIFVSDGFVADSNGNDILKYVYYALHARQRNVDMLRRGSGVPHVNGKMLGELPLYMPSVEEQKLWVRRFEAIDGLAVSLRAERDARRKQFEYYRDRLLTFPEKVA